MPKRRYCYRATESVRFSDALLAIAGLTRKDKESYLDAIAVVALRDIRHCRFEVQLNALDAKWFVMDCIVAGRLVSMCKLCLIVKGGTADMPQRPPLRDQHLKLHEAITSQMCDLEREFLMAATPPTSPAVQREVSVWLDIKDQIHRKGKGIYESLAERLQPTR